MKKYSIILLCTTAILATSCVRHSTKHIVTGYTASYVNETESTLAVVCNDEDSLKFIAPNDSVEFYFENDYIEEYTHSIWSKYNYSIYEFIEVKKETLYNLTDTTKLEVDLSGKYAAYSDLYNASIYLKSKGDRYTTRTLKISSTLLKYFVKDPQMTSKFSEFYRD